MHHKNTVHKSRAGSGSNMLKGCTLMLVMTLMVMGCDSIVDQQTNADSGVATSDISGVLSVVQAPPIECIDTGNDVSNEKRNPRSVERERGNSRNPIFGDCNSETKVVEVTSATGRIWMDRNLGASRVATSSTDEQAYGDLYQWGRLADGHQVRTSGTTTDLSSTDTPGHGDFITPNSSPYDWRSPQNNNLWQGVDGINNPCPVGYRIPTMTEWHTKRLSWDPQGAAGAFDSPLKLTLAGYRSGSGSLYNDGSDGLYWSSTAAGTVALGALFSSGSSGSFTADRSAGASVRCIKEVTSDWFWHFRPFIMPSRQGGMMHVHRLWRSNFNNQSRLNPALFFALNAETSNLWQVQV